MKDSDLNEWSTRSDRDLAHLNNAHTCNGACPPTANPPSQPALNPVTLQYPDGQTEHERALNEIRQTEPDVLPPWEPEGNAARFKDGNPKDAIGRARVNLHLIPPSANILEARVLELGAKKYGAYNWRAAEVSGSVYISAMLRHLYRYMDGEDNDPESGQSHLAHIRANTAIMIDALSLGRFNDDRPIEGSAAFLIELKPNKGTNDAK